MTIKEVAAFALRFPDTTEEHPFGEIPDVYKVAGRIFVIISPDTEPPRVSLKCDPELAELIRRKYAAVTPGYHLNKRHWNTIALNGTVPADEIREMIHHSYEMVIAKLPKAKRESLMEKVGKLGAS